MSNEVTERGIECIIQNIASCQITYERCRKEYECIRELKYPTHNSMSIKEMLEFRKQWLLDSVKVDEAKSAMTTVYANMIHTLREFYDIGFPEEIDICYNGYCVSFCSHANGHKTFWVGHMNVVHAFDVPAMEGTDEHD